MSCATSRRSSRTRSSACVAQLAIGATVTLTVVYTAKVVNGVPIPDNSAYAAIEFAIGLGNLLGGLVVGAIGGRMRKGRLVVSASCAWVSGPSCSA